MVAPTASAVMGDILSYLGIPPQYTEDTQTTAEGVVPYVGFSAPIYRMISAPVGTMAPPAGV